MGIVGRWKYRKTVIGHLDFIYAPLQAKLGKSVAIITYGAFGWRKALNYLGEHKTDPIEAAVAVATEGLEKLIAQQSEDRRKITLYALQTGNTSNHEANNFIAIVDGIKALTGDNRVHVQTALYTLSGALQGLTGLELIEWRRARTIEWFIENSSEDEIRAVFD